MENLIEASGKWSTQGIVVYQMLFMLTTAPGFVNVYIGIKTWRV